MRLPPKAHGAPAAKLKAVPTPAKDAGTASTAPAVPAKAKGKGKGEGKLSPQGKAQCFLQYVKRVP